MRAYKFDSPEFDAAVAAAGHQAFLVWLAAGLPVFYVDRDGLNVVQYPDGRKFEIRWVPDAPSDRNYEIVRELKPDAV